MGLDDSYTNIRGQILLMLPMPLVSKAYSMLRQEEKQRETPKPSSAIPTALNTYKNYSSSTNQPRNNPSPNPQSNTQNDRRSNFRKGVFCAYCKKEGHSKEECFKLLGYPLVILCTTNTFHHHKGLNKELRTQDLLTWLQMSHCHKWNVHWISLLLPLLQIQMILPMLEWIRYKINSIKCCS